MYKAIIYHTDRASSRYETLPLASNGDGLGLRSGTPCYGYVHEYLEQQLVGHQREYRRVLESPYQQQRHHEGPEARWRIPAKLEAPWHAW